MKLAKALTIAILIIGFAGCGAKDKKKNEQESSPVSDLNIVPGGE